METVSVNITTTPKIVSVDVYNNPVTVIDDGITHIINGGGTYQCLYPHYADGRVKNSDNTINLPVPTAQTITFPDTPIKNTVNVLLLTAVSGVTSVLPNISFTDSDSTVYSIPAGQDIVATPNGTADITDSLGTLLYTVSPGDVQAISDSTVHNSDNSYSVNVLAEQTLSIPDITVTNPITGGTYAYPAKKNLTESVYKEISLFFKATYDDIQEYTISEKSAATYTQNDLVNCTVIYEINNVAATLPFSPVNTNVVKATITRTNPALDASVTIKTS